jgi:type I restriction enzyme M protein
LAIADNCFLRSLGRTQPIAEALSLVQHPARLIETDKKGKEKDKDWTCDLISKSIDVARYYAEGQTIIDQLNIELGRIAAKAAELEYEYGGDEGVFAEPDKVNKASHIRRSSSRSGC